MLEATSLWQASEWVMRAIQSVFPRPKDTIRYEGDGNNENIEHKVERKLVLKLMVLLYNYRLEGLFHAFS
jgi:hypothetical protein